MFAAGKTAAVSGETPDAQFNYVTMLLHGDGTNGAQNNTFLDSSTNNFTITRNGNTTQGSFSPYGSNWSNYFGTANGNALLFTELTLSSDFTIETWIYPTAQSSSGYTITFSASSSAEQIMYYYTDGRIGCYFQNGANGVSSAGVLPMNVWSHVAVVRSGSTVKIYVNGVDTGVSISGTTTVTVGTISGYTTGSGYNVYGYLSNVRIGTTAVYTSNFTPPTAPLTAITGTLLLTCQSNRYVDNSTSARAITTLGTPSVQRFNPFGASTAYSTSVIGGSGYFDGSGDYLTWPSGSSVAFGTGDFTVECWVYLGATPTTNFLFDFRDASNTTAPAFIWGNTNSGVLDWTQNAASGPNVTSTGATWNVNTWYHIAYVRSGTTGTIYQNGVSIGSATDSTNYTVTPSTSTIAARYGSPFYEFPNGYISNVRIVKGTAVYTGSFTPPTAPLTAITNTSLLLSMTNGAIFDNAMMNDLETVGNAQISTSVVKYGTGSLKFDGTGDYLKGAFNPWLALGTGDYTIELWINFSSVSTSVFFGDIDSSGNGNWAFFYNSSVGVLRLLMNSAAVQLSSSSWTPSTSTWYHIAICRASGTYRFFVNGTVTGSGSDSTNITWGTNNYYVGSASDGGLQLNGYIDDLRITKGFARYTGNFTAPTRALSDTGPI